MAAVVVAGTDVQAPRHKRPGKIYLNTILSSLMFARGDEQGNAPRFLSCWSYVGVELIVLYGMSAVGNFPNEKVF